MLDNSLKLLKVILFTIDTQLGVEVLSSWNHEDFQDQTRCLATVSSTRRASRMMPSSGFIRTRRPVAKRGSLGAGLRASSVRGARCQNIARSATVNCCNAGTAVTRHH